ncbi:hypothetical protein J1605_004903 [Eschrichtius robustus]|uniref:Uncharacterized protein n=1 Tax=Eschrichtius robustus TaxID=9764 RepID=A0AB34HF63_ESCRO|nr:hypothetical protein J1605_004903 [Eschrichtius robustus]
MSLRKALSTTLGSERTLNKAVVLMATLQASTSYKHRLTLVKYVSRDSYFQSNTFTWNQNETGQKDARKVESRGGQGCLGAAPPAAPLQFSEVDGGGASVLGSKFLFPIREKEQEVEKPLGCLKDNNPMARLPVTGQRRDEAGDGRQLYTLMILLYVLCFKKKLLSVSLVAQRLRIRLPMQGTRVRALVWEDLTCRGATKPVSLNY